MTTNAKDLELLLCRKPLYHSWVPLAPRACKEFLRRRCVPELVRGAKVGEVDEPHLALLLDLFQVSSVGDKAANAGPCPKTKAKSPACTEVLSVRAGRQSGDQVKNFFRDFWGTKLNLVKSVGRPETLNCRTGRFSKYPTRKLNWLSGLETGHPDGELLHDLGQVGDDLVQTNKFTSEKVLVHASSPPAEQNDEKRQEEPREESRDQKES